MIPFTDSVSRLSTIYKYKINRMGRMGNSYNCLTPCLFKGIGKNNLAYYHTVWHSCPKQQVLGERWNIIISFPFCSTLSQNYSFLTSYLIKIVQFICKLDPHFSFKFKHKDQLLKFLSKRFHPCPPNNLDRRPGFQTFHERSYQFWETAALEIQL